MEVTNFTVTCTRTGTITIGEEVACSDCTATVPATTEAGVETQFGAALTPADCSATRTFSWSFGDGSTSSQASPLYRYCTTGTFTWTLTVTINGVACTRTGVITVNAPTALECSVSSYDTVSGCPRTVHLEPQQYWCMSQTTYVWDFGDGQISTARSNNHTYSTQGTYDYTMTASLAGGTCTSTGTITVGGPSAITCWASPPSAWGAPPLEVAFQAGVEPTSCIASAAYAWDFGDGGTSTEQNPTHTYDADGLHAWTMTVTAEGKSCTDSGFVVASSQTPDYTWVNQPSATSEPLMDVHFTTPDEGWAAGSNGVLRHTTDGGRGWAKVGTFGDTYDFRSVHFVDQNTGWLLRDEHIGRTTDRGATWKWGSTSAWSQRDMFATSATSAWVTGRTYYIPGLFYPYWDRYDAQPSGSITEGYSVNISYAGYQYEWSYGLSFVDADNGWSVGSQGWIYKITNATTSSPTIVKHTGNGPSGGDLYAVQMLDPTQGWAVGAGGRIIHTTDAWQNWTAQESGVALSLRALYFADTLHGWTVGDGGLILATADGGSTWAPENSGVTENLRALHGAAATPAAVAAQSDAADVAVWAVGDGGTILKRIASLCQAITITPEALSAPTRGAPYSATLTASGGSAPYSFSLADGTMPPGLTLASSGAITGTPTTAGSYELTVAATDQAGCTGTRRYTLAIACSATCSGSSYQVSNALLTIQFNAIVNHDCQATPAYAWQFGDGATSNERNPAHAYPAAGDYSWTLTVTLGSVTCTASGVVTVRACTLSCSANGNPASGPPPLAVTFSGSVYAGSYCGSSAPTFAWDFGDGTSSTLEDPSHTYTEMGSYNWTMTASAGGVTCTRSGTVLLGECALACSVSTMLSTSVGEAVKFWGTALPSSCAGTPTYDWSFGDATPHSNEQNPSHTYTAAGTYTWSLTVTVDGKTCTKTGSIKVCALDCTAVVPASSRVGALVTFAGSATATSCESTNWFEWDYGDGSPHGYSASSEHSYAATGTYPWTLRVSNFGTTCTRTGTITIAEAVACTDCSAVVPAATEVGTANTFRTGLAPADCSATMTYAWTFGDGGTSTAGSPTHTYCAVGTYSWTLTATINGAACNRSGTITVSAPTALDCSVSVGETGACPYEASFTAQTSGCNSRSTYVWAFGDGAASTSRTPTHIYTAQGGYDWTMTTALAGATCARSGTITVAQPTAITAVGTPSTTWGAPPLSVAFAGGLAYPSCVSAAAYSWTFGDGATAAAQNPSHTYGTAGFYTWVLTATADGLTSTAKGPIIVAAQAPLYTWAPQLSGTLDPIVDVYFTGETEGWTAAQRGLRHTSDGGRTWALSRDTLNYAVRFLDQDTGFHIFACGIGRTANRGQSWSNYSFSTCPAWRYSDVFPTAPTVAWATATDGKLWHFEVPGGGSYSYGWRTTGASNLSSLWFTDADNGWAVGTNGKIVRITNGSGEVSDALQPSGTTARLNGIVMLDANNGWIVGDDGTILHTTNGGSSWAPVSSGTTINLRAVDFRDGSTGWIVGNGGLVLATTDGGTTWSPEISEWTRDLRSVSVPPGQQVVYAVGVNGTLLKRLPLVCPGISIAPATLPPASIGVAYSQTLTPAGGSPPYRLGLAAGALLEGLQLASSGAITGTPQTAGPTDFTARAVDAEFCSGDQSYALTTGTSSCTLTCSATARAAGQMGSPLPFQATATATGCSGAVAYLWTFGDGTTSILQNPSHSYAATGSFDWVLTVTVGGQTCTRSGTIGVGSRIRTTLPRAESSGS